MGVDDFIHVLFLLIRLAGCKGGWGTVRQAKGKG